MTVHLKGSAAIFLWCSVLVGICFVALTVVAAQQGCSGIEGRMTTPEGWVIPNVKVRFFNKVTKQSENVTTDEIGQYSRCLSPGFYDVVATAPGFKPSKRKVKVEKSTKHIIDFPMKRGKVLISQ